MKTLTRRQLVLTLTAAMGIATGHAADGTWNVDANGTWTTATNWSSSTVADGSTASAYFGSTTGSDNTFEITANRIVTLSGPQTIDNLYFGDTTANATKATWTVTGSTLTLGDGTTAGTSTIGVTSNLADANISSILAGANSLTKTGAGTLYLSGNNTYSGGTTLSAGSINVNTSTALGSGAVTITGTTGTLGFATAGINLANKITLNSAGVSSNGLIQTNLLSIAGTVSGDIDILKAGAGGHFYGGASSATALTLSGKITATSGLTVTQRGGVVIYSGSGSSLDKLQTTSNTLNTIKLGATNGLATNAIIDLPNLGGTAVQTLDLAGFSQSLKGVTASTLTTSTNSLVTNSGASTSTLTLTSSTASTFGGVIQNGTGTVALAISGGNQTLSGTNTYSGGTSVTSGTLALSGTGAINSSALSVSSGATFKNTSSVAFSNALTVAEGALFTGTTAAFTPTSVAISGDLSDGFTALNFVSSLTKSGALTVSLINTKAGTYNLISSTTSGLFSSVTVAGTALVSADADATFSGNDGTFTYTFTNSGNTLAISSFSAVPEPATYAALAGLVILGFAAYRRRQSVAKAD